MPQLSLYLDEDTLQKIEAEAKLSGTSVSKYVTSALRMHFTKTWPDWHKDLFGSISDESFAKPESIDFSLDARRESL